jgi:hypothetical protein
VTVSRPGDGGAPGAPLSSNVFDCFSDGVFENLSDSGTERFSLEVLAFTKDGFPAALQCLGGVDPTGNPCAVVTDPGYAGQFAADARWRTTCSATQQAGVPVLAVCPQLEPTDSGAGTDGGDGGAADASSDGS